MKVTNALKFLFLKEGREKKVGLRRRKPSAGVHSNV